MTGVVRYTQRSVASCFIACVTACNPAGDSTVAVEAFTDQAFYQWRLPSRLREISGLALTADQRLLAITDEVAIIYELDFRSGDIVKEFVVGSPVLRGDFEGLAMINDALWLLTSDGMLYRTVEGDDRASVPYAKFDSGLGDYCEFEGLGENPSRQALILACKEPHAKKNTLRNSLLSVGNLPPTLMETIDVDSVAISDRIDSKRVRPSAITQDPATGNLVMLAAQQKALITLSPDGQLIDAIILPGKGRHRQAEGIEISAAGHLLIADEGGDGKARLAVYRWGASGPGPE